MTEPPVQVIVIGGGHAGVEAAWAAANLLSGTQTVALVTLDPAKIGVMSCNPAIGGLAKGQIVREIDALGGLMGLATDATGIQFKVLNTSKGAAVHGPRAQCDKHAYARQVQAMLGSRPEIRIVAGSVEQLVVERGRCVGVVVASPAGPIELRAPATVLTTGTFMRGLMHTGETRTPGGRFAEPPAVGISAALADLGFELGRLKTGTPPRLKRSSIDWDALPIAAGDAEPTPFSDLSALNVALRVSESRVGFVPSSVDPTHLSLTREAPLSAPEAPSIHRFPVLSQVDCRQTSTTPQVHDLIRANLHRAPMYSGQIASAGPRYCPSIEDKVVRFADRTEHGVFLEPESLEDDWIYCNGISTSLPADVQDAIVRAMPGCARAEIYRYGYAVEYDMVRPHQIDATAQTKLVEGLFLAGQINGTSGYEEAAAQGLLAGLNAARTALAQPPITLGRDRAYIGVLMDDLVTKTPVEPYRMFTSRAEHRLLLRADNAADRLTPLADELGLLASTELGRLRRETFARRSQHIAELNRLVDTLKPAGDAGSAPLRDLIKRPEFTPADLHRSLGDAAARFDQRIVFAVHTERFYAPFIERQHAEVRRAAETERRTIPASFDFSTLSAMRAEARLALSRFRPTTLGQAGRLEGVTPADVTLLSVMVERYRRESAGV